MLALPPLPFAQSPRPRSRVRVLFLIDGLGMGGAERLLGLTLPALRSAGLETRVCSLQVRDGNPAAAALERSGILVDVCQLRRLRNLHEVLKLFRYLSKQEFDVLHTQLEASNILGTLYARLRGIPAVCTLHTVEHPRGAAKRRDLLLNWVLRNHSLKVICVSDYVREHYTKQLHYPAGRLLTVHNGIELSSFTKVTRGSTETRRAIGIPANAQVITTVAVLRGPKGIDSMIRAMPAVLRKHADAHYLIVGDGEHEGTLKSAAHQLGLSRRVVFVGRRSDIPELMSASDVFVLPSLREALPTVLAEAMAASLPIVATNVGGIPEMVIPHVNGFLVPPGAPDSLALSCISLLDNPDAARDMGIRGRQIAERRFGIEAHASRLRALYEEVLARSRKEPLCGSRS
jgi:glycosyltransferase involved in cell wall biosynthesis